MANTPHSRHIRRGRFSRLRRSKKLLAFLSTIATKLAATGTQYTFTANVGSNAITITAHGLSVGDGPFVVSATTTLPSYLDADDIYFVGEVVDANNIRLTTKMGEPVVTIADAGSGTLTMAKGESAEAIYEYLRKNSPETVRNATDVDNL